MWSLRSAVAASRRAALAFAHGGGRHRLADHCYRRGNRHGHWTSSSPSSSPLASWLCATATTVRAFSGATVATPSPPPPVADRHPPGVDAATVTRDMAEWAPLNLSHELLAALHSVGITNPSEIQQIGIPLIRQRRNNVLLGAQTGTGKTLAFLLPVMQALHDDEKGVGKEGVETRLGRPRGVIIVPNRELAYQVLGVAKLLAHHLKLRVACVSGGGRGTHSRDKKIVRRAPIDLLIATPGRLRVMVERYHLGLSDVRVVVVDEVDTVLDATDGFTDELFPLLESCVKRVDLATGRPSPSQFIFAAASVTQSCLRTIAKHVPLELTQVRTRKLHHLVSTLTHEFRLVGQQDKLELCLQTLQEQVAKQSKRGIDPEPTLIFCNSIPSARALEHFLQERGVSCVHYHGMMPPDLRAASYDRFLHEERFVMVCTDMAARGLDTTHVTNVIMFDFPLNPRDYLHRVGRTARAGRTGHVVNLVTRRDRVLAEAIKRAVSAGVPVNQLSSSRQDYRPDRAVGHRPRERGGDGVGGGHGRAGGDGDGDEHGEHVIRTRGGGVIQPARKRGVLGKGRHVLPPTPGQVRSQTAIKLLSKLYAPRGSEIARFKYVQQRRRDGAAVAHARDLKARAREAGQAARAWQRNVELDKIDDAADLQRERERRSEQRRRKAEHGIRVRADAARKQQPRRRRDGRVRHMRSDGTEAPPRPPDFWA